MTHFKHMADIDRLRERAPEWFKEHEQNGWGCEVVSALRMRRWFITKDDPKGAPEFTVWEVDDYDTPREITVLSVWPNLEHAKYELELLTRALKESLAA
jgi:hypothetical protein